MLKLCEIKEMHLNYQRRSVEQEGRKKWLKGI